MAKNTKIQKTVTLILFLLWLLIFSLGLGAEAADTLNSAPSASDFIEAKNGSHDNVINEVGIKEFLNKFDERKDYTFLLIVILIVFVALLVLPFMPAIRELRQKKDDKPLFVSMEYTKDPRFFDHSFRSKLLANVHNVGVDRCFRVSLSGKEELIEVIDANNVDKFKFGNHALYLEGDARITNNMKFQKEVYVTGETVLQENTRIRAILSEKDLHMNENCSVVRWAGSEENIYTASGCDLGVRCSCEKVLHLAKDCSFKSLYGHPIITDFPQDEIEPEVQEPVVYIDADNADEIEEEITDLQENLNSEDIDNEDLNRPLYETITFRKLKDDKSTITKNSLVMSPKELSIPEDTVIGKDLIVKSRLVVGAGSEIQGSVKGYQDIILHENVEVNGDIFTDGKITLSKGCRIWGNVFCQQQVDIASDCEIGTEGIVKSVIAKKGVKLAADVKIHGYLLTEGRGISV